MGISLMTKKNSETERKTKWIEKQMQALWQQASRNEERMESKQNVKIVKDEIELINLLTGQFN